MPINMRAGPCRAQTSRRYSLDMRPSGQHKMDRLGEVLVRPSAMTERGGRGNKQPPGTEGALAVIYGEPDSPRFLAAVQRLKRQQRKKERLTRLAKQRVRVALRKMREC
jgi:hypothetical protein